MHPFKGGLFDRCKIRHEFQVGFGQSWQNSADGRIAYHIELPPTSRMPVPAHNRCVNLLLPHSVCGVFSCHVICKAWIHVYRHVEYVYLLTIFDFQLQELRYPYHGGLSCTNTTLGGESPLSRHIDEHRREHDTVRQRSTKHHHHPSRADRGRRLFQGNVTAVRNSSGNRCTY
jgi:hypothetical protein